MTAKEQAICDIKEELTINNKCFIAYSEELTPIIDIIVNDYIKNQETI